MICQSSWKTNWWLFLGRLVPIVAKEPSTVGTERPSPPLNTRKASYLLNRYFTWWDVSFTTPTEEDRHPNSTLVNNFTCLLSHPNLTYQMITVLSWEVWTVPRLGLITLVLQERFLKNRDRVASFLLRMQIIHNMTIIFIIGGKNDDKIKGLINVCMVEFINLLSATTR